MQRVRAILPQVNIYPRTQSCRCSYVRYGARPVSRMNSWRAIQEAGKTTARGMSKRAVGRAPVMGVDETIVKVRGKAKLLGFVAGVASMGRDRHGHRRSVGWVAVG